MQTRFAQILYFRMETHKAACFTLAKVLFEINEDMVEILLMLAVLFTQDTKIEDLLCCASSGSDPSLFFSSYFLSLWFFSRDQLGVLFPGPAPPTLVPGKE